MQSDSGPKEFTEQIQKDTMDKFLEIELKVLSVM